MDHKYILYTFTESNKTNEKMINFSKTLTFEQAKELYKSVGMQFVDTKHNRAMMKSVIDSHLKSLREDAEWTK